jgi:murein DD-endopeptidase MepM/ murein hydrolase activator NlpD
MRDIKISEITKHIPMLFLKLFIVITSVIVIIFLSFGTLIFIRTTQFKQVLSRSTPINFGDSLPQRYIKIRGVDYAVPLKKGLSDVELFSLFAIRLGEWESRMDSDLAGDRDSCGPYQQRLYEVGNIKLPVGKKAAQILKENYNDVFSEARREYLKLYYNSTPRINAFLSSGYGKRDLFNLETHYGVDYPFRIGTPVSVVAKGKVSEAASDSMGGNVIVVWHEQLKKRTLYAHLDTINVKVGDVVDVGNQIGTSGNTGFATTGPHLHFQIMEGEVGAWNDRTIDPNTEVNFLQQIRMPFLAHCTEMINIHLKTGLFDEIAIERLKTESTTKEIIEGKKMVDLKNVNQRQQLIDSLCLSQRPVSCATWVNRVSGYFDDNNVVIDSLLSGN